MNNATPLWNVSRFNEHVTTLTVSQRRFITLLHDWFKKPKNRVVIVSGGPGTGKTYAVTQTLNHIQCNQLRMAPTARVAQNIGGKTLHSTLMLDWKNGSTLKELEKRLEFETDLRAAIETSSGLRERMHPPEDYRIVIIDEVGMIPFWFAMQIFTCLFERAKDPVLIVAMGDKHQLRPVRSNENVFDIPWIRETFETHMVELSESKRFSPEYDFIVQTLCSFLDRADIEGMFRYMSETYPIVDDIDSNLLEQSKRALAYLKETVKNYNKFYLDHMIPGNIVRIFPIINNQRTEGDPLDLKRGCIVFVTKNGCSKSVNNGTVLVFDDYHSEKDALLCHRYRGKDKQIEIYRDKSNGQFPVVVGFAATVHKFQGETIDEDYIVINFNGSKDLNLIYTGLSRVRSMRQILAVKL